MKVTFRDERTPKHMQTVWEPGGAQVFLCTPGACSGSVDICHTRALSQHRALVKNISGSALAHCVFALCSRILTVFALFLFPLLYPVCLGLIKPCFSTHDLLTGPQSHAISNSKIVA